jgi:hypothetical protein
MMPDVAQKFRLSRVLGVEFPFGHAFGMPKDAAMQRRVCEAAIDLLDNAGVPESRFDVDIEWPQDTAFTYRDWQPSEPSPIVKYNLARRQELEARGGGAAQN